MPETVETQYAVAFAAVAAISMDAAPYSELSDTSLLELTRLCGQVQQAASTRVAIIAGEIARRSAPLLGQSGLAQAAGYRTPQELLRSTTGSTVREATQAVRAGQLANGDDDRAWLAPVGAALVESRLSVAAAESISTGLGSPTVAVSSGDLAVAAAQLCHEASMLDADRLLRRARELRDELDETGIADREAERREQRSLTFYRRLDGLSRLTWVMDSETAASVGEIYDRATSPRRGGPRFVASDSLEHAEAIAADTRTTEQLASDVFSELLRAGVASDSSQLLGSGAPSVRVLVSERAVRERSGHGYIEGQTDPISIETVERLACGGSTSSITFDTHGQPLDVGREQRLFTRRQRVAIAARDGGCRWPSCERPPSWTEAHHIEHWHRDGGRTDTAGGILLCKHHHLLAHNNHWEIHRDDGDYWLLPPPERDPLQRPVPMPSRSRAAQELRREQQRELGRELVDA